jgi:hypothetical protein
MNTINLKSFVLNRFPTDFPETEAKRTEKPWRSFWSSKACAFCAPASHRGQLQCQFHVFIFHQVLKLEPVQNHCSWWPEPSGTFQDWFWSTLGIMFGMFGVVFKSILRRSQSNTLLFCFKIGVWPTSMFSKHEVGVEMWFGLIFHVLVQISLCCPPNLRWSLNAERAVNRQPGYRAGNS